MFDENEEDAMKLEHYLEIGAVTIEGVNDDGEMIFAIQDIAKEIAPELWQAHTEYVDAGLLHLYENGLMEVEYDENLEATLHLSKEGYKVAKELGLVEMDIREIPDN